MDLAAFAAVFFFFKLKTAMWDQEFSDLWYDWHKMFNILLPAKIQTPQLHNFMIETFIKKGKGKQFGYSKT